MPVEIPKFSNAIFRNIPKNLSHIFDANLTHFFAEMENLCPHRENYGKNYQNSTKISVNFCSEISAYWKISEILDGDKA